MFVPAKSPMSFSTSARSSVAVAVVLVVGSAANAVVVKLKMIVQISKTEMNFYLP